MRSIIVSVQRQPDANTVAVTDAVHQMLPEFDRLLPPTIKLSVLERPVGVDPRLACTTCSSR